LLAHVAVICPTETAIHSPCEGARDAYRPVSSSSNWNTVLHVLDERLKLVLIGVRRDLSIGGTGAAR